MRPVSIAVLKGDGIGPDVVDAAVQILGAYAKANGVPLDFVELPCGLDALRRYGSTLPEQTLLRLPSIHGWILGPVSNHEYDLTDRRYLHPSGHLRKHYDLFANIRPSRSHPGVTLSTDIDLVVVRENTEGFYADRNVIDGNGEFRPTEDTVLSLRVVTRSACLRICKTAFELAMRRRRKVTAVHKANILKRGDGLFLECCRQVAAEFPEVTLEDMHVDATATDLVTHPQRFDVIVTTNMFGDILSSEAAGVTGGLGLAGGLNIGHEHAMAQATHGSAPDIQGLGIANPISEVLSGVLLLRWLADAEGIQKLYSVGDQLEKAIDRMLAGGKTRTPDLGGTSRTQDVVSAILQELDRG